MTSSAEDPLTTGSWPEELRIGEWLVEPAAHRMFRGDRTVRLEPKVMAVLVHLAERAGKVVDKDEVLAEVWPDTVVSEVSLPRVISDLRRALDDDARNPRYVETIPKKGYRMIAEVEAGAAEPAATAPRSAVRYGAATAVLLMLAVGWWQLSGSGDTGIESLAVLPLRNLSSNPDEEYFADAMTDLVITDLAKLGCLRVVAGASALR